MRWLARPASSVGWFIGSDANRSPTARTPVEQPIPDAHRAFHEANGEIEADEGQDQDVSDRPTVPVGLRHLRVCERDAAQPF